MPPLPLARRVLPVAAAAILAVAAAPSVAAASTPESMLVNASGGWDPTMVKPVGPAVKSWIAVRIPR